MNLTINHLVNYTLFSNVSPIRLILMMIAFLPAAHASEAPSPEWKELSYQGSKMFITLLSQVARETLTRQEAMNELIPVAGQTARLPAKNEVLKTRVRTRVLGNESTFTIWQNPDLGILQRNSLYTGLKDWFRTYRHLDSGVYSIKIKPRPGEDGLPWQSWSKRSESIYRIPEEAEKIVVSESEAIFDLIAQGHLKKPGDTAELFIYDRDGIIRATLEAESVESIPVDYSVSRNGEKSTLKKTVSALKTNLWASSYLDNKPNPDFKFLGYKDNIRLYIDTQENIALRLSGKADYVGDVVIDLQSVAY